MMTIRRLLSLLLGICASHLVASEPWPGETVAQATDLTPAALSSATVSLTTAADFYEMSDAFWNANTRQLWTADARSGTYVYAFQANPAGTAFTAVHRFAIGSDGEGITQAMDDNIFYILHEGPEKVTSYRADTGAKITDYTGMATSLVSSGNSGPEGLTFVPDASLSASGFRKGDGVPDVGTAYPASQGGLGGIFLIASQNGGYVYAYDLPATSASATSAATYLGRFLTGAGESSGLAFDRSNHRLFISHNTGANPIEVTSLTSTGTVGSLRLQQLAIFTGPQSGNVEGIAVTPARRPDGTPGDGWFFTVTDNDRISGGSYKSANIVWYKTLGARFTCTAGTGQSAEPGQTLPITPAVALLDGFRNPLIGAPISYTVTSGGGTVAGGSSFTNAFGSATVGAWTLGNSSDVQTVRVDSSGVTPLSITARAIIRIITLVVLPQHLWTAIAPTDAIVGPASGGVQRIELRPSQEAILAPIPVSAQ
ncbi:hypothetical protein LBMAG53_09290 [Planctomycetota bacterium]|nr:hypothetical protein LBMAG53_09290 [Planctomycetota bacterium]